MPLSHDNTSGNYAGIHQSILWELKLMIYKLKAMQLMKPDLHDDLVGIITQLSDARCDLQKLGDRR